MPPEEVGGSCLGVLLFGQARTSLEPKEMKCFAINLICTEMCCNHSILFHSLSLWTRGKLDWSMRSKTHERHCFPIPDTILYG